MSVNLYSGYESVKRVKLPEGKTNIDVSTPLGASTMAALIRANNSGNFENIGNTLALNEAVTAQGNNEQVIVDTKEVTVLKDDAGVEHELTNPKTIEVYCANGCRIMATKIVEVTG